MIRRYPIGDALVVITSFAIAILALAAMFSHPARLDTRPLNPLDGALLCAHGAAVGVTVPYDCAKLI